MRRKRGVHRIPWGGRAGYGVGKEAVLIIPIILFLAVQSAAEPQAKLQPRSQTVPRNGQLHVALELTWTGDADLFDIPRPDLSGLPDFELVDAQISTERAGDENRLRYSLILTPLKEGIYDLAQVNVQYFEKGKDIATAVALPLTNVKVTRPALIGRKGKLAISVGVFVAVCAMASALLKRSRERSRLEQAAGFEAAANTREGLTAELDIARRLRIEGETGAYLEKLCTLAGSEPLRPHVEKADELRELTESVKFGGQTASPDQLNWAEKQIRETIRKAFPIADEEEERMEEFRK